MRTTSSGMRRRLASCANAMRQRRRNSSSVKPRPKRSSVERPSASQACGARPPGWLDLHVDARVLRLRRRRAVGHADRRAVVAVAEVRVERIVPGIAHRLRELRAELGAQPAALGRIVGRSRRSAARGVMRSKLRIASSQARMPAGRRSARSSRAGAAPPQPSCTAASFQPRSTASPMPVFMPSPPFGGITCTASPARNTRPCAVALGDQVAPRPRHRRSRISNAKSRPDRAAHRVDRIARSGVELSSLVDHQPPALRAVGRRRGLPTAPSVPMMT